MSDEIDRCSFIGKNYRDRIDGRSSDESGFKKQARRIRQTSRLQIQRGRAIRADASDRADLNRPGESHTCKQSENNEFLKFTQSR